MDTWRCVLIYGLCSSTSFIPECVENLKPKVGMTFEGLEAVENFYKYNALRSLWIKRWSLQQSSTLGKRNMRHLSVATFLLKWPYTRQMRSKGAKEMNGENRKRRRKKPRSRSHACARRAPKLDFMIVASGQAKMFKGKKPWMCKTWIQICIMINVYICSNLYHDKGLCIRCTLDMR